MAQQFINVGVAAGDGTGDKLRTGGEKINDNFDELYADVDEINSNAAAIEAIAEGAALVAAAPAQALEAYATSETIGTAASGVANYTNANSATGAAVTTTKAGRVFTIKNFRVNKAAEADDKWECYDTVSNVLLFSTPATFGLGDTSQQIVSPTTIPAGVRWMFRNGATGGKLERSVAGTTFTPVSAAPGDTVTLGVTAAAATFQVTVNSNSAGDLLAKLDAATPPSAVTGLAGATALTPTATLATRGVSGFTLTETSLGSTNLNNIYYSLVPTAIGDVITVVYRVQTQMPTGSHVVCPHDIRLIGNDGKNYGSYDARPALDGNWRVARLVASLPAGGTVPTLLHFLFNNGPTVTRVDFLAIKGELADYPLLDALFNNAAQEYRPSPGYAFGKITFSGQPAAGSTITINGTAFTFVGSGATGNQINIGGSLKTTLANAVAVLNASTVAGVTLATYSADAKTLGIAFDAFGTAGLAFTLAAGATSNGTASAATLQFSRGLDLLLPDQIYIPGDQGEIDFQVQSLVPPRMQGLSYQCTIRSAYTDNGAQFACSRTMPPLTIPFPPERIGATLEFHLTDLKARAIPLAKTVNVTKLASTLGAAGSLGALRVLLLGDSTTANNTAQYVGQRLTRMGYTFTSVGTRQQNGGMLGEGYTGWMAADMVGLTSRPVLVAPGGEAAYLSAAAAGTAGDQFPWLRASTGGDSAAYVRNGVIFDPGQLQTRFGLPVPDRVLINLFRNDADRNDVDDATAYAQWDDAMTIMIQRIAAAWPACKIGVWIFPGATGYNGQGGVPGTYQPYARRLLELYRAGAGNIYFIPPLTFDPHSFSLTNVATDSKTGLTVNSWTDEIHPSQPIGRAQVSAPLAWWCAGVV